MKDHTTDHRRIYAKGFYDGLEAARQGMTPARFEANLSGQSAIAKKVFEMVPIKDAWSMDQIMGEMLRVTRARIDAKVARACVEALKESGLVREVRRGQYQRVEVKARQPSLPDPFSTSGEPESSAPATEALPVAAEAVQASRRPIDMLAEAAARLKAVAQGISDAAADLENIALVIEEEFSAQGQNAEKFKQLQALLKSLT